MAVCLKLPLPDSSLDRYRPGDEIEAQGTVVMQFGMTMLEPERITVLGRTRAAPAEGFVHPANCRVRCTWESWCASQATVQENPGVQPRAAR